MKKILSIFPILFVFCAAALTITAETPAVKAAFAASYTLEAEGKYAEAAKKIQTQYQEKSYEMNMRLGWLNYLAGFFTESSRYYLKAIDLFSYSIEAQLGYVGPEAALGHWDIVIGAYKKILEIDPMHSKANYRLGSIYYGKKNYKTAQKYLEKVVNTYPMDYYSTILLGWTYFQSGQTTKARALFEKTLLLSPNDESALNGLSLIK